MRYMRNIAFIIMVIMNGLLVHILYACVSFSGLHCVLDVYVYFLMYKLITRCPHSEAENKINL